MTNSLIGDIPKHQYVWIDTEFTHQKPVGFMRALWFAIVSHPGRVWGCTVLLESGAVYRSLPPHAIAFCENPAKEWGVKTAQRWNCYGTDFSTIEYKYLRGLDLTVKTISGCYSGKYLFTAAPVGDAFSDAPDQAKEFTFAALDNGRLTIQPTNNVLVHDISFTETAKQFPNYLKRQTEVWSCE